MAVTVGTKVKGGTWNCLHVDIFIFLKILSFVDSSELNFCASVVLLERNLKKLLNIGIKL